MANLPTADTQEKLGGAYIKAVVARAGYTLVDYHRDEHGHDYTIKAVVERQGRVRDSNWSINIQAKSTYAATVGTEYISYELDVLNYNDLVDASGFVPLILVVYVMPRKESDWLLQSEDCLEIRNCAYWVSLRGEPVSANAKSVTVRLPRSQVFTPEAVAEMFAKIKEGTPL